MTQTADEFNGPWHQRVIALAGIFQAAALVDRLATTGYLPKHEFATCVESLLITNPDSTLDTYGELANLRLGLERVIDTFTGIQQSGSQQSLRYVLAIMHIQGKLMKQGDMLNVIRSRLAQVHQQAQHFEPTHDNVVANLADLYTDTISRFRSRIHVRGEATYLQQQRVANQIRTLLFAGIRSATLWRQLGGKRWQLLVQRQRILNAARDLYRVAKAQPELH